MITGARFSGPRGPLAVFASSLFLEIQVTGVQGYRGTGSTGVQGVQGVQGYREYREYREYRGTET